MEIGYFELFKIKRELYEWKQTFKRDLELYGPDHYKTAYARGGLTAAEAIFEMMGGKLDENETTEEDI